MSLGKTWYAPEEAAEQFGISIGQLNAWVGEGLVRAELDGEKIVSVNIDDVRLEVQAMVDRS